MSLLCMRARGGGGRPISMLKLKWIHHTYFKPNLQGTLLRPTLLMPATLKCPSSMLGILIHARGQSSSSQQGACSCAFPVVLEDGTASSLQKICIDDPVNNAQKRKNKTFADGLLAVDGTSCRLYDEVVTGLPPSYNAGPNVSATTSITAFLCPGWVHDHPGCHQTLP